MKNFKYAILFLVLIIGCGEEQDRTIRTNLPSEAQQLYSISKAQYEHIYFSLTSWEQFNIIDPLTLPGCPTLVLEAEAKRVTLTYEDKEECPESSSRNGRIILDLALQSGLEGLWFMEFEDYSFEGDTLKGIKTFERQPDLSIRESFEKLKQISELNTSFELNGNLVHRISDFGISTGLISTFGEISGRNPAGRTISMSYGEEVLTSFDCSQLQNPLPIFGSEIWNISRGNDNSVTHTLSYETAGFCQTTAKMQLPDGRTLILNP